MMSVLAALVAVVPALAQTTPLPQCSDGIDNDGDNAIDGADAGCGGGTDNDESDSVYQIVTVALPVVTLQGTVDAKGTVDVSLLQIRAYRGSTVDITCAGKRCPFKSLRRTVITTSLRIRDMERKYRAPLTLKIRISRPSELGKYVRYKVRRKKPPIRKDFCLDQTTGKVRGCYVG